eukprot:m.1077133 g.1077133  ORF g.1077133 m.1077133 type:complete len:449 (+) comp24251_c0_seq11:833-2179(+)
MWCLVVLHPDRLWEGCTVGLNHTLNVTKAFASPFSGGVFWDPADNMYKMWYRCNDGLQCYATSVDGIAWTKPMLDVVNGTNIVISERVDGATVWLDGQRNVPRSARFKMAAVFAYNDYRHYTILHSADGVHWIVVTNSTAGSIADRSTVFFNPFRSKWVYSIKQDLPPPFGRSRAYWEAEDLDTGATCVSRQSATHTGAQAHVMCTGHTRKSSSRRGALQTVSLFTTGRMPTSSTLPGDAGMRTTRSCIIWMLLRTKVCLSACSPSLPASTAPMEPASTALVNGTRSLSPSAAMAFTGRGRWSTASTLFSCPWTRQSPHPGGGTKRTCSRLAAGSPCNAKGRCDSTWEHAPGPTSLKETHLRELRSCVAMDLHLCRQRLRSVAGLPSFACLSVHCDYPVCACHSALRVVPPAVCNAVVLLGTWETAVDMRMHLVLCAPCCSDVCLGGR